MSNARRNLWNIDTMSVRVERAIAAPPAAVFDAWLDPESRGSPWHGVGKAIVQPVPDGLFYRMHLSEGGDYELAHYGRFLSVERPGLVRHTWVSQHTRGIESIVTVRFEPQDGGRTQVVLTHDNLPDDAQGRRHEWGWQHYLGLLADVMGS